MAQIGLYLLMAVLVLMAPLWLPVVVLLNYMDKRRLALGARDFACVECGTRLGPASLELAHAPGETTSMRG